MYLKMHYYVKVYNIFFRVFIIMYLKNALLDVLALIFLFSVTISSEKLSKWLANMIFQMSRRY